MNGPLSKLQNTSICLLNKQNPRKEIKYCQDSFGNTNNINKTHTGYTALNEVLCFRFLAKQYNFTKCTFLMNH